MKYLGVVTPFKGIRVYTRAAMGMPGPTDHLDELMSRVLGDLLQAGVVANLLSLRSITSMKKHVWFIF